MLSFRSQPCFDGFELLNVEYNVEGDKSNLSATIVYERLYSGLVWICTVVPILSIVVDQENGFEFRAGLSVN